MAYTHSDKIRFQTALDYIINQCGDNQDALDLCRSIEPALQFTDAENFAYDVVLPAMPTDHDLTTAQVVARIGLDSSEQRRVGMALIRLRRDDLLSSIKTEDRKTAYRRVA